MPPDDKALAVLMADPGVWYCVSCWSHVAGRHSPEDYLVLRAHARLFANNATPGALCYAAAECEQPGHVGHRLAVCVRINR